MLNRISSSIAFTLLAIVLLPSLAAAQCPSAPTVNVIPGPCRTSLSWNFLPFATGYEIQWSTTPTFVEFTSDTTNSATTWTHANPPPNTPIYYRVRGTSPAQICSATFGPFSPIVEATANVNLTVPQNFQHTLSCDYFTFTWNAVPGANRYSVRLIQPGSLVETFPTDNSVVIYRSLFDGNPINLELWAGNDCGEGPKFTITLTYPAGMTEVGYIQPPTIERALGGGLRLSWNPAPRASSYRVLRRQGPPGDQVLTADFIVPDTQTAFVDAAAPMNVPVSYTVAGVNAQCGQAFSNWSSSVTLAPLLVLNAPVSITRTAGQSATLSVTLDNAPPGTTYQWLRNGTVLANTGRITGAQTPTLVINSLLQSDSAHYAVRITPTNSLPLTLPASIIVSSTCPADFDGNGSKNLDDVFIFLNAWFANCP